MRPASVVAADLTFEVEVDGGTAVHGTLRGRDSRLVLEVDDPSAFAGNGDAGTVRAVATGLARRGLVVQVVSRGEHLVTLGDVAAPWWQRWSTGSRHIRLGSARGLLTAARGRTSTTPSVLPDASLVPPGTLLPLVPTMRRRARRGPTTTHDPARGGGARLVAAVGGAVVPGQRQSILWLDDDVTTIGSDPACDVVLAGLEPLHAEVLHDEDDEFVLVAHSPDVRVHGARTRRSLLRTGTRVELGDLVFAYYREEYADHGRPYGGRVGGELGHQRPQPPRHSV